MTQLIRWFSLAILLSSELPAQRLYNVSQDTKAQAAVAASALVRDSSVFDTAVANLAEVQRLQQENILIGARLQTRADVNSWSEWSDVLATVARVRDQLQSVSNASPDEWKKALTGIADRQKEVNESLSALKAKLGASNPEGETKAIGAWFEKIGRLKPVADYLLKISANDKPSQADLKAANEASATLTNLATLYRTFATHIPERPSTIYLGFQLQLLEADEQHYKNLMGIRQRRDEETAGINKLAAKVIRAVGEFTLQGSVVESLRAQAQLVKTSVGTAKQKERDKLDAMLTALLGASAVAARGHMPSDLADQRGSLEIRAHMLRRSRLAASVYEDLLANGAHRLAGYYSGGIRPSNLAALLHALTTAGVIPAILTSK